jgi:glycosyltransferase involved in cell wall biosynthesis
MVIGMFGRLISWKGQDVLIRALHLLKIRRPRAKFHCVLVGGTLFGREPEYRTRLETMIKDSGLSECVDIVGNVDHVYPYYDMTDVVVHASIIPEPFGLVVSEGMAKKKIVIATSGGGPSEMINHGVNGFLYPAGSEQQLAATLTDLSDTFETNGSTDLYLNEIATRARKTIVENFSIERSVSELEAVYQDILS